VTVKTRVDPVGQTFQILLDESMGPKARSQAMAQFAREQRDQAKAANARVLGKAPPVQTFVDGREGASEDSVKADDGQIVYEFKLINEAVSYIITQLQIHHPPQQKSGRFAHSFEVFADNALVDDLKNPPMAMEYSFFNAQPYARKIERWFGVAQAVATMAAGKYGNLAKITLGYRSAVGGESAIGSWAQSKSARSLAARVRRGSESLHTEWLTRQPAIILRVR
jgi:hypothetical protein